MDANPELVALLHAMKPELPEDPEPAQVEAWIQLADLVQDPEFRASVRRMAQYEAAERAAGDQTGLHHDLTVEVTERVRAAIDAGIDPATTAAAAVVDDLMSRYAATFHTSDTPAYRGAVLRRVEIASEPRVERYLHLLGRVNGWPEQPSQAPVFDWLTTALCAHKDTDSGVHDNHSQRTH